MMKRMAMGAGNSRGFSSSISAGRFPQVDSITFQGVFEEHYYTCDQNGQHSQHSARILDIDLSATENKETPDRVWVNMIQKSKFDGTQRDERGVDFVIVLDKSGSMTGRMGSSGSQMEVSRLAISKLFKQLRPDQDSFALTSFDNEGVIWIPLTKVADLSEEKVEACLQSIKPGNGTTLQAGFDVAMQVLDGTHREVGRERRILFLTDMGDMQATILKQKLAHASQQGIYTSILGVGIKFEAKLTEEVIKVPGANYFNVATAKDLEEILVEEFYYNFFPIAHDVEFTFSAVGYVLDNIYGCPLPAHSKGLDQEWLPESHKFYPLDFKNRVKSLLLCVQRKEINRLPKPALGMIMDYLRPQELTVSRLETVFPAAKEEGNKVKGGLIMLALKSNSDIAPEDREVEIALNYSTLSGDKERVSQTIRPQTGNSGGLMEVGRDDNLVLSYILQKYTSNMRDFLSTKERHLIDETKVLLEDAKVRFPDDDKFSEYLTTVLSLEKLSDSAK